MTPFAQQSSESSAEAPAPAPTRTELYARLLDEHLDADALQDLVARYGDAILERDVPYLVVAARNQARSTARRDRRRSQLEEVEHRSASAGARMGGVVAPAAGGGGSIGRDPLDIVAARQDLSAALAVLAHMDPRNSWPLWWHAAGFDDHEIVAMWNEAGFDPPDPGLATIRKRRERTRQVLRRALPGGGAGEDPEP